MVARARCHLKGKELNGKRNKKLEEKLAEAVASTGQDEQNKQDTASKEQIHSHRKFSNQKWSSIRGGESVRNGQTFR